MRHLRLLLPLCALISAAGAFAATPPCLPCAGIHVADPYGLLPALAAVRAGKRLLLANKEALVVAGGLFMEEAAAHGAPILPIDSEHVALHQALRSGARSEVRRLMLTASGGPFRTRDLSTWHAIDRRQALAHPTWAMGAKISIDSATLMNKGLEVIEARWLFGQSADTIEVVVHPQSVIHSMVELRDGSIIAQLGVTDMRLPIQYAFSYPDRWDAALPSLDVARLGTLDFLPPDVRRFPCLDLAYQALREGGAWPVVLNAANEVAVAAFLEGRLSFPGIPRVIARALEATSRRPNAPSTLAEVRDTDAWARRFAAETIGTLTSSE